MSAALLIVEDDPGLRASMERSLARRGHEVHGAATVAEAHQHLQSRDVDLVLVDIRLPDGSGMEVLATAREVDDEIVVVVMTAFPDVKLAVHAMRDGAHDFIGKPFELDELHLCVERALEARALRRSVRRLERERQRLASVGELLGDSPAMEHMRDQIRRVAQTDAPVLVTGETGTGKELIADSIHRLSRRSGGPLIKINCSSLPEHLLESELFGHEKGAYTDAKEAREGIFEMSDGGTLLLDEITEMKPGLQAKLLRVVEGHPFHRVGGRREIHTDVRIVATTNRDLPALIAAGGFREDLYFRLNVFRIEVPPLRNRGGDVGLLAKFYLEQSSAALRKRPLRLSLPVQRLLQDYDWPGNVRELRNVMERAAILCEADEVGVGHVPSELQVAAFVRSQVAGISGALPSLEEIELRYIRQVVQSVGENLSEAARVLGISRNTLKSRLGGAAPPAGEKA
jgi:DNA-binding NtrC family response regulator